jgi:quinohemoprotein ethanol dehydrogenase
MARLLAIPAAALLLATGGAATMTDKRAASDWPLLGQGVMGQRFSALGDINEQTVSRLGLAFEFKDFVVRGRTHRGMEATPLMIDGILYFSGPWGVAYAVDARNGKHLWTYDPEPDGQYARNACCDVVSRGVAVADGRVFTASLDGHLAAVDARTGKELWKTDTLYTRKWNYSITGAPYVAGNYVLIGNAGADMGARGYVSAYEVASGKLAWRFWAVPGDPADGPDETPDVTFARKSWPKSTRWELGLGGNAWDAITYDPETNTAFLGIGNGGPHPAWLRATGEGDQLFLSSIVAVDAATGRRKWHYQTTPGDSWDYTATSPMVLADLKIDGRLRKVIMQAPKNGFFYVLDRTTGELLRAAPYTRVNWASGIDPKTHRPILTGKGDYRNEPRIVWPSAAGGHAWTPMAFSPRTGLVYLPVYDAPMSFRADKKAGFLPGSINQATHSAFPPFTLAAEKAQLSGIEPPRFEGRLKAIDPISGAARWVSGPLPFINGGTLVVGDLVFQGAADGYLSAYDAASGKRVLHLFVGTSIMAAPITYALDDVQYIALLAGAGGPQGSGFSPDVVASTRENYERLIVLRLDGAAIPIPPQRTAEAQQPMPAPIAASPTLMARGQQLYQQQCHRCHVLGGAVGNYPNLWNMPPEAIEAFDVIVAQGALRDAGMADFSDTLTPGDIAALKAFIINDTIEKRKNGSGAGAQHRDASH